MHAIVDHTHDGFTQEKKEVDSHRAKQGKASEECNSQLNIMYCIPKLCFMLHQQHIWPLRRCCCYGFGLHCFLKNMLNPAKIQLHKGTNINTGISE